MEKIFLYVTKVYYIVEVLNINKKLIDKNVHVGHLVLSHLLVSALSEHILSKRNQFVGHCIRK